MGLGDLVASLPPGVFCRKGTSGAIGVSTGVQALARPEGKKFSAK